MLLNLVLAPFVAALFAPLLVRFFGTFAAWLLALVPVGIFWQVLHQAQGISAGQKHIESHSWFEALNANLSFQLDGLSFVFTLLISGIGVLILIYAGGYLKGHKHLGRFLSFLLAFMGSMLGVVLSDNLISLFVFWELTSLTSFFLIGFNHENEASRRGALQALVITGLGGLLMLAGFMMLGALGGTYEVSQLLAKDKLFPDGSPYAAIFLLIAAGAFTKSAQFPFHSWLPNAMAAPTPVSAYLHSATMVKAGVYLLMRMSPMLGGTDLWMVTLTTIGALTLLSGALLAVAKDDLKLVLAYTTVASLGLLVMALGIGSTAVVQGAVLYLIAHALFKGALFMIIGNVDHGAGTRKLSQLGGLRRAMPVSALTAILAACSMMGLPFFVGFLAKETLYEGLSQFDLSTLQGMMVLVAAGAAILGNGLMFGAAAIFAIKPFWGRWVEPPKPAHEGGLMLLAGPVTLAALGLAGLFVLAPFTHSFVVPMSSAVLGRWQPLELHWFHGLTLALMMTGVTIVLGLFIYASWAKLAKTIRLALAFIGWGPDKGFDQFITGLVGSARFIGQLTQSGALETYLRLGFLAVSVTILAMLFHGNAFPSPPSLPDYEFYQLGIIVLGIFGILLVLWARTRLTAIVSLGVQGVAVALIFMLLGAPDLSFTQFMVETLSVVILALVLTRLHLENKDRRKKRDFFIDGSISLLAGVAFAALLLSVVQAPLDMNLSEFFGKYAKTMAHGSNIVNVILVDFRALDTLGEITVVLVAGLAIMSLIRLRPRLDGGAPSGKLSAQGPKGDVEPLVDEPEEEGELKPHLDQAQGAPA